MRLGDVECDARHGSLRRYEQRLERSEKTTSGYPGTARMSIAAHRARDRGASGDRRRLSQSGRDRSASADKAALVLKQSLAKIKQSERFFAQSILLICSAAI